MIITDKLIFLQLQKTASTHIGALLVQEFAGREYFGKHRPLPRGYDTGGRLVVGSVRNPWDWYLSLWTFGCRERGGAFGRSTAPRSAWSALRDPGTRRAHGGLSFAGSRLRALAHEWRRPVADWRRLHADPDDPARFREWLALALDSRRRFDLFRDYGQGTIAGFAGLMTFLYALLYWRDNSVLFRRGRFDGAASLQAHDAEHCRIAAAIRTERLEQDFLEALSRAGHRPTAEQVARIESAERTNVSGRRLRLEVFYDRGAAELVADRESLIVGKYGYRSPLAGG